MKGCRIWAAAVCVCLMFAGCSFGEKKEEQTQLEFTVVDEKKAEPFKLTYGDSGYLYLCVGYGRQPSGGYSISVNALYATDNAVYLDTELTGPKDVSEQGENPSYPYIVIKMPFVDKTVVFD